MTTKTATKTATKTTKTPAKKTVAKRASRQALVKTITTSRTTPAVDLDATFNDPKARRAAVVTERAALKAWQEAKGKQADKPATPVLDAITSGRKATTPAKKSAPVVEAPKAARGELVLELRTAGHAEVVAGVGVKVTTVDRFVVLARKDAQSVLDGLTAASVGAGQMVARKLNLAALALRHAVPTLVDQRSTRQSTVITALIESGLEWTVTGKFDCTPTFTVAGVERSTIGAVAEAVAAATK